MPPAELVVAGFIAVGLLATIAQRIAVPHAVVLVLGGLALGFVPATPAVRLDPDVVFLIFLPPLIYAASFTFASEDIRTNVRPIVLLAFGLVGVSVVAIAVLAHLLIGLPWAASFVLGAVVAPTDPVAATAVLRETGAPSRLATILEGESLVNDGVALSLFKLAVGALGAGTFDLGSGTLEFAWIAAGGSAIGVAVGWVSVHLRRWTDEPRVGVTIALVSTYGAFLAAEQAGASGILASVFSGLYVGHHSMRLGSPDERLHSYSFWQAATFLIESVLFLLIGLEFQAVAGELGEYAPLELVGYTAAVVAALIVTRAAWMVTVPYLVGAFDRRRGQPPTASADERVVLTAAGMRGAVTVAAALAVPIDVGGGAVDERELIILLAYGTVIGTLVLPALTLPLLLRALGLARGDQAGELEHDARMKLAHAALERAEEIAREQDVSEEAMARVRAVYEMRLAAEERGRDREPAQRAAREYQQVRRELVRAEREELARLRRERRLSGEPLRRVERELDLEEARLER